MCFRITGESELNIVVLAKDQINESIEKDLYVKKLIEKSLTLRIMSF